MFQIGLADIRLGHALDHAESMHPDENVVTHPRQGVLEAGIDRFLDTVVWLFQLPPDGLGAFAQLQDLMTYRVFMPVVWRQ